MVQSCECLMAELVQFFSQIFLRCHFLTWREQAWAEELLQDYEGAEDEKWHPQKNGS